MSLVSDASSVCERVEAWQTPVTSVSCHTWLTAASSRIVTSSTERTFGVTIAGQTAISVSVAVKPFLAPLTVDAISVVIAVEAAESVACLSVKLLIEDALPGLPIAIADFLPGGGPGCGQEQRDAEAAAEPERGHGRAGVAARRLGRRESSALRCAFLFLDQVVLSTLLPDSVRRLPGPTLELFNLLNFEAVAQGRKVGLHGINISP